MVTVLWTMKQERKMRVWSGLLMSFNEGLRETSWTGLISASERRNKPGINNAHKKRHLRGGHVGEGC